MKKKETRIRSHFNFEALSILLSISFKFFLITFNGFLQFLLLHSLSLVHLFSLQFLHIVTIQFRCIYFYRQTFAMMGRKQGKSSSIQLAIFLDNGKTVFFFFFFSIIMSYVSCRLLVVFLYQFYHHISQEFFSVLFSFGLFIFFSILLLFCVPSHFHMGTTCENMKSKMTKQNHDKCFHMLLTE